MIDIFGKKVKYWITFNEQNLYFMPGATKIAGKIKGKETMADLYIISHHLMLAHAQIANYLHEKTSAKIGGMLAYSEVYPASSMPKDILYARQIDEFLNKNLLDAFVLGHYSNEVVNFVQKNNIQTGVLPSDLAEISKMKSDFIAFSYYQSSTISSTLVPEKLLLIITLNLVGKRIHFYQ